MDQNNTRHKRPRSTKEASRARRNGLAAEVKEMRDLLPVAETVTSRLSQLHVLTLSHAVVAKSNLFLRYFPGCQDRSTAASDEFDFISALPGFLAICQLDGKLLYVSENISYIIGHTAVDTLSQTESLFDLLVEEDQLTFKNILDDISQTDLELRCMCRMQCGRLGRRSPSVSGLQTFDKYQTMLLRGRIINAGTIASQASMLSPATDLQQQPVLMMMCSPHLSILDSVVQSSCCSSFDIDSKSNANVIFRSVHGLDMKFIDIEPIGKQYLGVGWFGESWYNIVHPADVVIASTQHQQLLSDGCRHAATIRVISQPGSVVIWLHVIMCLCDDNNDVTGDQSRIVCYNHVISEDEVMEIRERDKKEEREQLAVECADNKSLPTVVLNQTVWDTQPTDNKLSHAELMNKLKTKMRGSATGRRRTSTESEHLALSSVPSPPFDSNRCGSIHQFIPVSVDAQVADDWLDASSSECLSEVQSETMLSAHDDQILMTSPRQFQQGNGDESFFYLVPDEHQLPLPVLDDAVVTSILGNSSTEFPAAAALCTEKFHRSAQQPIHVDITDHDGLLDAANEGAIELACIELLGLISSAGSESPLSNDRNILPFC